MIYGYARISTYTQKTSLTAQKKMLKAQNIEASNIFFDIGSGSKMQRKGLLNLLKSLQEKDELVVCKLDRLARNTKESLILIDELFKKNITLNILNLGKIENNPIGKMLYTLLLSVAEMEKELILERSKAGKEHAKNTKPNYKEGRPKAVLTAQKKHAFDLLKYYNFKEVSKKTGFSISTLHRIKKLVAETSQKNENIKGQLSFFDNP